MMGKRRFLICPVGRPRWKGERGGGKKFSFFHHSISPSNRLDLLWNRFPLLTCIHSSICQVVPFVPRLTSELQSVPPLISNSLTSLSRRSSSGFSHTTNQNRNWIFPIWISSLSQCVRAVRGVNVKASLKMEMLAGLIVPRRRRRGYKKKQRSDAKGKKFAVSDGIISATQRNNAALFVCAITLPSIKVYTIGVCFVGFFLFAKEPSLN